MSSTTVGKTLQLLQNLFASYVLPEQLVTDNGLQFMSAEFHWFMKANGTRQIKSAPYHPATNGEAERFVQTFKRALKASNAPPGNLELRLLQFLLNFISTP